MSTLGGPWSSYPVLFQMSGSPAGIACPAEHSEAWQQQGSPVRLMGREGSMTSSLSSQSVFSRPCSKRAFTSVDEEEEETPTKRSKDVTDMYCEEAGLDTWGQSPFNVHMREASRVLELGLPPAACSNGDRSRAQLSSDFQRLYSLSPADLPASLALCCAPPPAEPADTDFVDTFRKLCAIEAEVKPDPQCLAAHSPGHSEEHIDACMRAIVLSWLIEVASEFGLHQETLFLAGALLDRFLSASKALPRSSLQLLSVACVLIACKNEEERYPSVHAFTNIADNCFEARDLLRMEGLVLQSLEFRVNTPTCYTFLSLLIQHVGLAPSVAALSIYLLEISMLEYALTAYAAPVKAASAFLLASACDGIADGVTAAVIQALVCHDKGEVRGCCEAMLAVHQRAFDCAGAEAGGGGGPFAAAKDKYRDCAWHCVSHVIPLEALPEGLFAMMG